MKSNIVVLAALFAAGCATPPLTPAELATHDADELCVGLAEATITGTGTGFAGRWASGDAVAAALRAKGASCEPWDKYAWLAQQRINYRLQQQAMGQIERASNRPLIPPLPRHAPQNPALPAAQHSQTVCHDDGAGHSVCDTVGN